MMKSRKGLQLEWKVSEESLRKKDAGEEAYFRSILLGPEEEGEDVAQEFGDEQELMENIFDHDIES